MQDDSSKKQCLQDLTWWSMLVVAVLAIPSLAFVIVSMIPIKGSTQLVIFVVACWICTYIGMRLMQHPKWPK